MADVESKKVRAIELMAIGGIKLKNIARSVNVAPQTISAWRRDPEFMERVVNRSRELLKENLPDVYKSLTQKSKEGNDKHIKIFLDHIEKLEEARSRQTKIVFNWKSSTGQQGQLELEREPNLLGESIDND